MINRHLHKSIDNTKFLIMQRSTFSISLKKETKKLVATKMNYSHIFVIALLFICSTAKALPSVTGSVSNLTEAYSINYDCMYKYATWEINVTPGSLVTFTSVVQLQSGTIILKDGTNNYSLGTSIVATGSKIYVYYEILEWDPYYYSLSSDTPLFQFFYATESGYTSQDKLYLKGGKIVTTTDVTISNPNGYVQIGAQSTGNATINTDKTRFLFNKPIWVQDGTFSSNTTSNLSLQTNGTPRMTILNSNGNVGIGTTAAATNNKLTITAALNNEVVISAAGGISSGNYTYSAMTLGKTNNTVGAAFNLGYMTHNTDINLSGAYLTNYGDAEGTTGIFVKKGGNVGIGTIDPKQTLTIDTKKSASNAGVPATTGTNQNGILRLQVNGDSWGEVMDFGMNVSPTYAWIQPTNRNNLGVNYDLSLNPNGGNVGISTTTPKAKLDVGAFINTGVIGTVFGRLAEGNTTGDGTFLGVVGYETQPLNAKGFAIEHHFWGQTNSSINFFRGSGATGGFITFNTDNNNERMRINSNGNVSIGLTVPDPTDAKLSVNGVIHAKEIRVDITGLADFVFHPTYNLMPLSQVEQYVKTNSHLPEMPSAAEVSKNGMNMGDMQNKLLQKVEELTLYIIELQKTNEKQSSQIKEQNSKIEELSIKIK